MARKPAMTSTQIYVRVILLTGVFVGVLYSMRSLHKNPMLDMLFNQPQESGSAAIITKGTINLCPTRVTRLEIQNLAQNSKVSIYQEKTKWVLEGEQKQELPPLLMERWLGEHCTVHIDKFFEGPPPQAQQKLVFSYIDGSSKILMAAGQVFMGDTGAFESGEFEVALKKLNP